MSRLTSEEQKERIRRRVRVVVDRANYEYIPETKHADRYETEKPQNVAVYARVSTDDVHQTTSYELQQKYYEDYVLKHPNWTLVGIYADEGISGTSYKYRAAFNQMIDDCNAGKIDMIICKSISRFARNVRDFLNFIRMLAEHTPAIGVFFESENIYSLDEKSTMSLSFQATMAEEESRIKSRSMESSLRMRLDHGLPLTPKLLGFTQNADGKLIIDVQTANIPKLMFFMYLYGYSTQQIADALTYLGKKSYRGNVAWTANGVAASMRNERYCGDVYTRKRFKLGVTTRKTQKNYGERPISRYYGEHDAIVSRDDFIAVQHMLDNARYRNKSILPELRVITDGVLKGYVIINPRWGGFTADDYYRASASAYSDTDFKEIKSEVQINTKPGDFDFREFKVAHTDLFDVPGKPYVSFAEKGMKFSTASVRKMHTEHYVELLIHPTNQMLAVRPAKAENRNAVIWSKRSGKNIIPKEISCGAFYKTLFVIFGWNPEQKYRMCSSIHKNGDEEIYIFDAREASAYFKPAQLQKSEAIQECEDILKVDRRVRTIPFRLTTSFGNDYYWQMSALALDRQTKEEWMSRMEGQLCNTGFSLNVTDYETLRSFIKQELGDWRPQEANANNQ